MIRRNRPRLVCRAILLYLLLLAIWAPGCRNSETTWERIEASDTLKIGVDPTFPPFEVSDGQDLWGLDVDLSRELAGNLGLTPEFIYFGYDGLYDALVTKQVDVLISALVIIPERTRDFSYSESYFNGGQVLVSNKADQHLKATDLEGKTVAVELGSQGHVEITKLGRQLESLEVLTFASSDLALADVVEGHADTAIVDHVSARLYRKNEPSMVISDHFITDEPFSLVVRSEDKTLLENINSSLADLQSSGRLENIVASWLDER